jgi:hypothetical protein
MPLELAGPVRMQLLSVPMVKYLGVPSAKLTTPKSRKAVDKVEAGWLGLFEQPMTNAAIKAAPVMMCSMRINVVDA